VEELNKWALYIIDKHDSRAIPSFVYDLLEVNDPSINISDLVGFSVGWEYGNDEFEALLGLAVARGGKLDSTLPAPETLFKKLSNNPHIIQRFKDTFPFIDVSEAEKTIFTAD
jgi:hypothetical protein